MPYTGVSSIPLSVAVFLASDPYDHDESAISATALLKPIRQLVLSNRVNNEEAFVDILQVVPSRVGSAIHDGIERSWKQNYQQALTNLRIPQHVIDRILINPTPEQLKPDSIPVYLEQRSYKQVGKHRVSGKYDMVFDGRVEDYKTTSAFSVMSKSNEEKFKLQGSIYKWLNPKIVTKDELAINYIIMDWNAAQARANEKYPQQRVFQKVFPILPVAQTQAFVERKLAEIDKYWDSDESDLPECDDDDLWRSDPVFKYYKNGDPNSARSTKNFDTWQDAESYRLEKGGAGIVVEKPGQVMACKYCAAFSACTQKDRLVASGDLTL